MQSSHAYRSGSTTVICATLLLSDSRYCGNFVAITTAPDGQREIHERTCPGWTSTLEDALTCARAMAESIYPPDPSAAIDQIVEQRRAKSDVPDLSRFART